MALLAAAIGAVSCLLVAPKLVMRVGPRRCVKGASSIMCLVIAGVLFGEAWWTIGAIMVGFGLSTALFDVSVNAEANRIEQETGWKLMSSVHAMFSLGSMVGALGCAGLLRLGVAPQWQLAGFGLALLPVYLWAAHQLDGPHPDAHADENNSPFTLPTGPLLWMGMVGALGLVAEGALFDWARSTSNRAAGLGRHGRVGLCGLQRRHGLWPAARRLGARPRGAAAPAAREWRSRGGGHGHCAGGRPARGRAGGLCDRGPGAGQHRAGDVRRRRPDGRRATRPRRGRRVGRGLCRLPVRAADDRRPGASPACQRRCGWWCCLPR